MADKGFVVVSGQGVYLGGGRWSGNPSHKKLTRAPVYAKPDQDVLKAIGGGAEFREVEIDGSGFVAVADVENPKKPEPDDKPEPKPDEDKPEQDPFEGVRGQMGGESEGKGKGRRRQ